MFAAIVALNYTDATVMLADKIFFLEYNGRLCTRQSYMICPSVEVFLVYFNYIFLFTYLFVKLRNKKIQRNSCLRYY
jgi:hypothetical protein